MIGQLNILRSANVSLEFLHYYIGHILEYNQNQFKYMRCKKHFPY